MRPCMRADHQRPEEIRRLLDDAKAPTPGASMVTSTMSDAQAPDDAYDASIENAIREDLQVRARVLVLLG
jgi:hypothetical protein